MVRDGFAPMLVSERHFRPVRNDGLMTYVASGDAVNAVASVVGEITVPYHHRFDCNDRSALCCRHVYDNHSAVDDRIVSLFFSRLVLRDVCCPCIIGANDDTDRKNDAWTMVIFQLEL